MKLLKEKLSESLSSVLPISAIVLLLSISIAPMGNGVLTLFLFGTLLLISGMGLFSLGSEMSMQPLGEGIGIQMSKTKKLLPLIICCLIIGTAVTIAEPDLQVLAQQVPSIPNTVLILSVAAGVGIFLVISMLRNVFAIKLSKLLFVFYPLVLILAAFCPVDFIPAAFDSGGVTTGPITVPFIMALGAGMSSIRSDRHSEEDSFGLISLCSIGPILSVLILSIFFKPEATSGVSAIEECATTTEAFAQFLNAFPIIAKEVGVAILPIMLIFLVFQLCFRRFHRHQILRIFIGMFYTYLGLVLFLTGANVGFMPAGQLIGAQITKISKWLLVPVGMIIGYFVVAAEPAVHVLKKQVERISNGAITQKSIATGLAVGVAISVGVSMLRVAAGIPIYPILIVCYAISLGISFFVPSLYTSVAFDSGGVASGPMTTTFILPFAVGACAALGGNIMTDAFGIVAMVALTPLITIQSIGLIGNIKRAKLHKKIAGEYEAVEDVIIYYDEEDAA